MKYDIMLYEKPSESTCLELVCALCGLSNRKNICGELMINGESSGAVCNECIGEIEVDDNGFLTVCKCCVTKQADESILKHIEMLKKRIKKLKKMLGKVGA